MAKPGPVWPAPAVLRMKSVSVAARDMSLVSVISKVRFDKAERGSLEKPKPAI